MAETTYGKTPLGQLLYDLAFTDLKDRYLARKHRLPVQSIRNMRDSKSVAQLRRQTKLERKRR